MSDEITQKKKKHGGVREHLRKLVGGTARDFGDTQQSKFGFQILQLSQKVGLRLPPQLVDLDPRCRFRKKSEKRRESREKSRGVCGVSKGRFV